MSKLEKVHQCGVPMCVEMTLVQREVIDGQSASPITVVETHHSCVFV